MVCFGVDVKDIFKECENSPKSKVVLKLKEMIMSKVLPKQKSLDDLSYAEAGDKNHIKNILLLFNIETVLLNQGGFRFSFEKFVKNKWSLEHIHPQNPKESDDLNNNNHPPKDFWNWLQSNSSIAEDCEHVKYLKDHESYLISKFGDIIDEASMHSIENLALLDSKTNTSIGNNLFPVKRSRIIGADKQGKFIPIATKNVFLKYYTKNPENMYCWTKEDRQAYLEEIKDVLHKGGYLNKEREV